jgi:hypothetical protein
MPKVVLTRSRIPLYASQSGFLWPANNQPNETKMNARMEYMDRNLAVVAINGWNRFSVTFRVPPALKSIRVAQA